MESSGRNIAVCFAEKVSTESLPRVAAAYHHRYA